MRPLFIVFVFLCCAMMSFGVLPATLFAATDLPMETHRLLAKAALLMEQKKYSQAARLLDEGLARREAQHGESYYALGNCRLMLKEWQAAIRAYGQAVQLDPRHARAWQGLARAHYESNNFREAGRAFGKAYENENKKDALTLYHSAAALLMAGSHKEAIQQFERLFRSHPKAIKNEWQEYYIRALMTGGQGKKALPLIRAQVDSTTGADKLRWQELLLHQYVMLAMYREARQYARELIDADPGEGRWWRALTHIHLAAGQTEDALAALLACSHVTRLKPDEQKLLADLYLQSDIPAKAIPFYRKQLAAGNSTNKKQALWHLVMAYRQTGQDQKALRVLEQSAAGTGDAQLLMLQGELCYGLERYRDAAASFRQAAQQQGQHQGQAWLMAGYAALQAQDTEAGLQALGHASHFNQQKKQALSLLHKFAGTR